MGSDLQADVESVHNGQDALKYLRKGDYDIALIDLRLPIIDGFDLLQALRDQSNLTPVIIVSASRDPADIQRAKQLGAMSFISKSSSGKKIIETIQDVLDGKLVYCTEIDAEQDLASLSDQQWASLHNLTPRQLEVLRLVCKGLSNIEIAAQLSLSVATIKSHISAIFMALGAKSRSESIKKAQQLGLD